MATIDQAKLIELATALGIDLTGDAPAEKTRKPSGTRKSGSRAGTRQPRGTGNVAGQAKPGVITCQQAWLALGADPQYKPRTPDAPARNQQLWRLNDLGLLGLAGK